jgi:hypothetical protein
MDNGVEPRQLADLTVFGKLPRTTPEAFGVLQRLAASRQAA